MAKSTSGKWVSRVGSAGGGKTYTKARPSSFYAILVLIVVVGLALVVFSRYEYQHPLKKVVIEPAPAVTGTTSHTALNTANNKRGVVRVVPRRTRNISPA